MTWKSQLALAYKKVISCPTGKATHLKEAAALAHLAQLESRKPDYSGNVFQCKRCDRWHVGGSLWESIKRQSRRPSWQKTQA
jgi:hypothetical protein